MPALCKVGDFVPFDAKGSEIVHCRLVEVGCGIIRRSRRCAISISIVQNFKTQPAILIDLEHVYRNMRRIETPDPIERFGPRSRRLIRKPGNQIDVQILNAGATKDLAVTSYDLRVVTPSCLFQFRSYE